jgi:hypothetical protein
LGEVATELSRRLTRIFLRDASGRRPVYGAFLGNKVMVGTVNAGREYFEMGVRDMSHAEAAHPGWMAKLLTHPVKGLENWSELFGKLTSAKGAIKVFCEVASL